MNDTDGDPSRVEPTRRDPATVVPRLNRPVSCCVATLPSASLLYDTDDLARRRSLSIVQTAPTVTGIAPLSDITNGQEMILGNRNVIAEDYSQTPPIPTILAEWREPNGNTVRVRAIGYSWSELDAVVAGFTPLPANQWPGADLQERLGRCVDAGSRYGPTVVPEGWTHFVLQIQPTGACETWPFLAISLVQPGTDLASGKLVTIVVTPATEAGYASGEIVSINGIEATISETVGPQGIASQIDFTVDAVAINAHGNVDANTLRQIASTIGPIGETQWAQLAATTNANPSTTP